MKEKKRFYTELAYVVGIASLALGTALMERADFGMSMVVAPAYLFHLKISETFHFFTFGMAEYCLQAVILVLLAIVLRKVKLKYLFSFGTAVVYGIVLDLMIRLIALIPTIQLAGRIAFFVIGMLLCSFGVAMLFHTYITPEAYELFVKEVAEKLGKKINVTKTVYDCTSCLVAIILSFSFFGFGHFESRFEFCDRLKLRKYFE